MRREARDGPKWEALNVTPNWLYLGQPDLMIWRYVDTKLKDDPLDVLDNMYFQDSSHGHHSHQAPEKINIHGSGLLLEYDPSERDQ